VGEPPIYRSPMDPCQGPKRLASSLWSSHVELFNALEYCFSSPLSWQWSQRLLYWIVAVVSE